MKLDRRFATLVLMTFAVSAPAFAAPAPENLVRGVIGPVGSNAQWSNYTVLNLIPGSALFPVTNPKTVFYYGFTGGTEADIGNMVLYTTARGSTTITAVTPVKLGGSSAPTILLSNTSVCPVAPSTAAPCIVKFDPLTLTLSPASDYYLAVYTTNDSNNSSIAGTQAIPGQSSVVSSFLPGDQTELAVGASIPGVPNGDTLFLMYVMNQ
jgi:hypothetical protein